MRALLLFAALLVPSAADAQSPDGWKAIFDGKTLRGWTASPSRNFGKWSAKDGAIRAEGPAGQLAYTGEKCLNCEIVADVRINYGGYAGISIRAGAGPSGDTGYETPVNNASTISPLRTGSLSAGVRLLQRWEDPLAVDDAWTQVHMIVEGNHIRVLVNGKPGADVVDEKSTYDSGYVAFQKYDRGAIAEFKNIRIRHLSSPPAARRGR